MKTRTIRRDAEYSLGFRWLAEDSSGMRCVFKCRPRREDFVVRGGRWVTTGGAWAGLLRNGSGRHWRTSLRRIAKPRTAGGKGGGKG